MTFLSLLAATTLIIGAPFASCPTIVSSGSWSASASTSTVTATARTITFTACSTGTVKISDLNTVNAENLQASNNGAAYGSSLSEGSTITIVTSSDTLNFRGTSMTSGSGITANVVDNVTGVTIGTISISRP